MIRKGRKLEDGLGFMGFLEKNSTLKNIFYSLLRNNFKCLTLRDDKVFSEAIHVILASPFDEESRFFYFREYKVGR